MKNAEMITTGLGGGSAQNGAPSSPAKKKKAQSPIGQRSGNIFFYTMVALPIIQFIIFYIVVNFNSILLAFKEYEIVAGKGYVTDWVKFDNFKTIFSEWKNTEYISDSLPNALKYFFVNVCVVIPLTLLFAYYIYKKLRFYGFYRIMLFLPSVICNMVIVLFYRDFVEWVVRFLVNKTASAPIETIMGDDKLASFPLILLYVMISFSGSILLYLNAMSSISESTIEAAKIDGAGELRTFWHIVLPSIWGTIVSLLVLAFAEIGMGQANLYSVYGSQAPKSQQTLGYYVFNLVASEQGNDMTQYPKASAYGLLITLVIAPITIISRHLLLKYGPSEE